MSEERNGRPFSILFVCMGNICRSPAAEGIFRHMLRERGLEERILCESAGTTSHHTGNPPDHRMTAAARDAGFTLEGAAREILPDDLPRFDLILTMDRENLQNVRRLDPDSRHRDKIQPFCRFLREHEASEVPDPYYGGEAGFHHVVELLVDGCQQVIDHALEQLDERKH